MNQKIKTNLTYRIIEREGDLDYFIETLSYPIDFDLQKEQMSRLQFPMSRAVLVRTTPKSTWVTVHILRDVDLFSSFANFELNLEGVQLHLEKKEGYIHLKVE